MMPANRILTAGWAGWAEPSSLRRLDQLIDRLGIVERLADRQSGAHPPIQVALRQQLFVPPFRGDAATVEHENAVGVADGREPVGDHDGRAARAETAQRT